MSETNARKIFALGGVRSGKSRFASQLAESVAFDERATLIVTADSAAADDGMLRRIKQHKAERPAKWTVVETPFDLAGSIRVSRESAVIVDCLTVWLSNLLLSCGDAEAADFYERVEAAVQSALTELVTAITETDRNIVLIANDVGSGVAPPTRLGNVFADMQGLVNQRVAALCDEVYLMTAGIATRIK